MSNGTIRTIEYLEEAFSHGKIPTQCDFWDLLATFEDLNTKNVPLSGYSLMQGPLSTVAGFFAGCGNSDEWCTSYSLVCANSAAWFNVGQFVPLSGYATVTGPLTTQSIDLSGGSITNIGNSGLTFQNGSYIISNTATDIIIKTFPSDWGTETGAILLQTQESFNVNNPASITLTTGASSGTTAWVKGGTLNLIGSYGGTVNIQSNNSSYGRGPINILGSNISLTGNTTVDGSLSSDDIIYSACGNSTQWCSAWSIVSGGIVAGDYVPLSGNVTITNPISVDGCITADCITGLTSINLDGGDITNWSDVSAYYDLAGMDILPGDLLHIEYSPSAYDVVTPVPGLSAYPLSGHLAGIDSAITCISGVSALTFTNTTVAPTPVKTLSNYLLIKVNGSDMYLPLYT